MPDQPAGDERTASGRLSAKSRRSSAISLKSMDGKLIHSPSFVDATTTQLITSKPLQTLDFKSDASSASDYHRDVG